MNQGVAVVAIYPITHTVFVAVKYGDMWFLRMIAVHAIHCVMKSPFHFAF